MNQSMLSQVPNSSESAPNASTLLGEIRTWRGAIESAQSFFEPQDNIESEYSPTLCGRCRADLNRLANKLSDDLKKRRGPNFAVLENSVDGTAWARQAKDEASHIAQLLRTYQKHPDQYNPDLILTLLHDLYLSLDNLCLYLESSLTNH